MSYYFEKAGDTLWNPSLQVGKLFVALADAAAGTLQMPSGLSPADNDTCAVEVEVFERFAAALRKTYFSTGSQIHREMIRTLLLASLVMLERAGVVISFEPPVEDIRGQLDAVARTMAI